MRTGVATDRLRYFRAHAADACCLHMHCNTGSLKEVCSCASIAGAQVACLGGESCFSYFRPRGYHKAPSVASRVQLLTWLVTSLRDVPNQNRMPLTEWNWVWSDIAPASPHLAACAWQLSTVISGTRKGEHIAGRAPSVEEIADLGSVFETATGALEEIRARVSCELLILSGASCNPMISCSSDLSVLRLLCVEHLPIPRTFDCHVIAIVFCVADLSCSHVLFSFNSAVDRLSPRDEELALP